MDRRTSRTTPNDDDDDDDDDGRGESRANIVLHGSHAVVVDAGEGANAGDDAGGGGGGGGAASMS